MLWPVGYCLKGGACGAPPYNPSFCATIAFTHYHYQHRAELEVVVQAPNGRASVCDTLIAAIGAVLEADRTLGGICDWAEPAAPASVDLPIEGAAALKAAVITVVLHYTTTAPLAWVSMWLAAQRPQSGRATLCAISVARARSRRFYRPHTLLKVKL
jgi:hypothetical protein